MIDFYLEYSRWFTQHYSRPFTVTREEWKAWCKAAPARRESDMQFDVDMERREGWGYANY